MPAQQKRIIAVDAMRGFAITAILVLHAINHFLYPVYPSDGDWSLLNEWMRKVLFFLFEGKMYAIFALLFGFTFALQMDNARKREQDFRSRFYWRMLLLIGFGVFHAAFFPGGDPLVFYALTALVLPLLIGLSDRVILILAILMLLQPLEWLEHFAPGWKASFLDTDGMYGALMPSMQSGNFLETARTNAWQGLLACLTWALEFGRSSQTLGLFLIGMLMKRKNYFAQPQHCIWKRGLLVTVAFWSTLLMINSVLAVDFLQNHAQLKLISGMWQNLAGAALWTIVLYKMSESTYFKKATELFALYGKMSLSNFVGQAIIASYLLFPYGLNMAENWGETASLVMAMAIFTFQMVFTKYWLGKHKRGPMESLWHSFTWIKIKT